MSVPYIPPHLRNRKNPRPAPEIKIVEEEFPAMIVNTNTQRPQRQFRGPSFLEKVSEPMPMPLPNPYTKRELILHRNPPVTNHTWKSVDEEEEFSNDDIPEEGLVSPVPVPADEWKTVERKIKVKRDKVQDALDNGDIPLDEVEETAWDEQPEDYETYWDDRRN
jgi:hypothetical protein|uniref:Uncharacterized protein n=1 Tax=viral metagenome TaxID=1070528 RepID=A0A6C0AII2_9ZZZZ